MVGTFIILRCENRTMNNIMVQNLEATGMFFKKNFEKYNGKKGNLITKFALLFE